MTSSMCPSMRSGSWPRRVSREALQALGRLVEPATPARGRIRRPRRASSRARPASATVERRPPVSFRRRPIGVVLEAAGVEQRLDDVAKGGVVVGSSLVRRTGGQPRGSAGRSRTERRGAAARRGTRRPRGPRLRRRRPRSRDCPSETRRSGRGFGAPGMVGAASGKANCAGGSMSRVMPGPKPITWMPPIRRPARGRRRKDEAGLVGGVAAPRRTAA